MAVKRVYDTDVANEVGLTAAVVYDRLAAFWPRGLLTREIPMALAPYRISYDQTLRALSKLQDAGLAYGSVEGWDRLDRSKTWRVACPDPYYEREKREEKKRKGAS